MNLQRLALDLKDHEGCRLKAYRDSLGILTIGYGLNLEEWTITQEMAERLLFDKIRVAIDDAKALCPLFDDLGDIRQEVLANMAYNLGRSRLKGFKLMFKAIEEANYTWAAEEMMDSKWAVQVGPRATELAQRMRLG